MHISQAEQTTYDFATIQQGLIANVSARAWFQISIWSSSARWRMRGKFSVFVVASSALREESMERCRAPRRGHKLPWSCSNESFIDGYGAVDGYSSTDEYSLDVRGALGLLLVPRRACR